MRNRSKLMLTALGILVLCCLVPGSFAQEAAAAAAEAATEAAAPKSLS